MKIPKAVSTVVFLFMAAVLLAETPYATVVYAEGKQFSVIRAGKPVSYGAESPEAIGLAIARGDILQTSPGTYIEILIHPISASVQLAENTSFKCDADETGTQSKGELYYGRVRAKVAKLAGSSTYKITSPSLVAGVRGTDFGCDHIYVRPPAPGTAIDATEGSATSASASSVMNRVFCFEGSVLVVPAANPERETVMIGGGEMVESVAPTVVAGIEKPLTLVKAPVAVEVNDFWKNREFRSVPETSGAEDSSGPTVEEQILTEEEKQVIEQEIKKERNHKVRLAGSAALLLAGSLVAGAAYPEYDRDGMTSSVMANASFGGVLISSSLILLVYDLIMH